MDELEDAKGCHVRNRKRPNQAVWFLTPFFLPENRPTFDVFRLPSSNSDGVCRQDGIQVGKQHDPRNNQGQFHFATFQVTNSDDAATDQR